MEIPYPSEQELKDFLLSLYAQSQAEQQLKEQNKNNNNPVDEFRERLRQVTPELFAEYLTAKGIEQKCPMCGHDKITVPESGFVVKSQVPENYSSLPEEKKIEAFNKITRSFVTPITLGTDKFTDFLHKTYFPTHCMNCGYLNLYRTRSVLSWLDNKNEEGRQDA
ncbi:hypothetical protein [Citrobacter meridianamericanus]|uniref:hypothetical protein n=1 Tax=Citrobacter meridianamericanus TaxID=2894201 RepID=UPI00351D8DE3